MGSAEARRPAGALGAILAAAAVGTALCLLVWVHARWLGALPVLYLSALSADAAFALWWAVRFLTSGLPRVGPYAAAAIAFAGVQALIVVLAVTGSVPAPTPAERDADLFGVSTVFQPRVPVRVVTHRPTVADAAELPVIPPIQFGSSDPPPALVGDVVAVPVLKVHINGRSGRLLVRANTSCRMRGAVLGPAGSPPGAQEVVVAAQPTEMASPELTGPSGLCGPDSVISSYSVLDVVFSAEVSAVVDVGAGGPATPVG